MQSSEYYVDWAAGTWNLTMKILTLILCLKECVAFLGRQEEWTWREQVNMIKWTQVTSSIG